MRRRKASVEERVALAVAVGGWHALLRRPQKRRRTERVGGSCRARRESRRRSAKLTADGTLKR